MLREHMPHPMQPIGLDARGVARFKMNEIVRFLLDSHPTIGLNELAGMDFSVEDQEQFAQLIGYSLGGYAELSYVTDDSYAKADAMAAKLIRGVS